MNIIAWKTPIVFNGKGNGQRRARTHDPDIKSLMPYRLSQPGNGELETPVSRLSYWNLCHISDKNINYVAQSEDRTHDL